MKECQHLNLAGGTEEKYKGSYESGIAEPLDYDLRSFVCFVSPVADDSS